MKDKKRFIILMIVIVLTLIVCGIIVIDYMKDDNKKPNTPEVQVTNNIDGMVIYIILCTSTWNGNKCK